MFLKYECFTKITFHVADDQLSVQVDESGWAWLVHKERLIVWKIGQSPVAKVTERSRWKNFCICASRTTNLLWSFLKQEFLYKLEFGFPQKQWGWHEVILTTGVTETPAFEEA